MVVELVLHEACIRVRLYAFTLSVFSFPSTSMQIPVRNHGGKVVVWYWVPLVCNSRSWLLNDQRRSPAQFSAQLRCPFTRLWSAAAWGEIVIRGFAGSTWEIKRSSRELESLGLGLGLGA